MSRCKIRRGKYFCQRCLIFSFTFCPVVEPYVKRAMLGQHGESMGSVGFH